MRSQAGSAASASEVFPGISGPGQTVLDLQYLRLQLSHLVQLLLLPGVGGLDALHLLPPLGGQT